MQPTSNYSYNTLDTAFFIVYNNLVELYNFLFKFRLEILYLCHSLD